MRYVTLVFASPRYASVDNVGPFVVRPVVISRKLSKINQ